MIMCVLLCYPVSIRIYYQQGGRFLVLNIVFTHGVRMGGRPGGRAGGRAAGNSLSGLYLRNRKV